MSPCLLPELIQILQILSIGFLGLAALFQALTIRTLSARINDLRADLKELEARK